MNVNFKYIILIAIVFGLGDYARPNTIAIVDSLNDVSYDLGNSYPDSALTIAEKSLDYSKDLNYIQGQMTALYRIGRIIKKTESLDSSLYYFDKAEQVFIEFGKDSLFLAKTWVYQGTVYRGLGRLDDAIDKYAASYAIAKNQHDEELMGSCLMNASNIFNAKGEYEKALTYLHLSILNFSDTSYREIGGVYSNIGNIYDNQNRNEDAMVAYRKAYQNYRQLDDNYIMAQILSSMGNVLLNSETPDSALLYYDQANKIASENEFQTILAQVAQNKGEYFFSKNQMDSARVYFNKSLFIKEANQNVSRISITLERLGDLFLSEKDIDQALQSYSRSYQSAKRVEDHSQLKDLTAKISNAHLLIGNVDSALFYLQYERAYQDSISDQLNKALVSELRYNNEKHKVKELKTKNEKQASDLESSNIIKWLTSIAGVIAVIGLIVAIQFLRQRKRTNAKQKEIDNLLNKHGEETMNAMLDGQENEKIRISTELHDSLGSMLAMVKNYFKSIDGEIDQLKVENIKQFEKANDLLDEACEEVRIIAHNLSTGVLTDQGLFRAVKNLKEKIEGSGEIEIQLHTHGTDDDLSILNQSAIYRIIQESFSNILKHAEAKKVGIQLNVFEDIFNLIIEDNGVGFDANQMLNNTGMGLRSNKARVHKMNGNFNIDSGKGIGTTINIDIPIKKDKIG